MTVRGQVQTMRDSFVGLGIGLLFSILLGIPADGGVNFQSWVDPFIIITALPRRSVRNCMDAILRPGTTLNACWLPHGSDHVHRRGHVKQHFAG